MGIREKDLLDILRQKQAEARRNEMIKNDILCAYEIVRLGRWPKGFRKWDADALCCRLKIELGI